jgi:hypothetical protein
MFHFSEFVFMELQPDRLQLPEADAIMALFGEAGENPARVRRRKALLTEHPHPVAASREQAIGAS